MITIILIHPTQPIPVNRWMFKDDSILRIGRAKDNDIVIYNAVVSRHHIELWKTATGWEIVNFGANGTYFSGKPITQMSVTEGMVLRLGHSGPRLLLKLNAIASDIVNPTLDQTPILIPELEETTNIEDEETNDSTTRIEFFE